MERERFEAAVARRDDLRAKVQRIQGKLDASRQQVAAIEAECASKKIDPDNLDRVIRQLQARYLEGVEAFEARVEQAGAQLAPYIGSI